MKPARWYSPRDPETSPTSAPPARARSTAAWNTRVPRPRPRWSAAVNTAPKQATSAGWSRSTAGRSVKPAWATMPPSGSTASSRLPALSALNSSG